jgi:hypothetical protein
MANSSKSFCKLTIPLLVLLTICFSAIPAQAKYGGGSGTAEDPYLIYTAEQMNEIGLSVNLDDLDKCFKLMADIDLIGFMGTSFNIIGTVRGNPFTGVFDGNGHKISNFTYTSTDKGYIGLFSVVKGYDAEIKDLGLIAPNVDGGTGNYVGSLVGYLSDGTITNCYVEGGIVKSVDLVGGLVGASNNGVITKCYTEGVSVSGRNNVGGLVGTNHRSGQGRIFYCYANSSISGRDKVGGLVGFNYEGSIANCYSVGSVTGITDVGGLVGINSGSVSASFWDIETSRQTTSAGGTGKTTTEMQTASTFIRWACPVWTWTIPVWTIDEGNDYPRLAWENMLGEDITPKLFLGAGSGEPNDPYLIYTAEHLNSIGLMECIWDKHFKLMADIDLGGFTGTSFNIIGTDYWHPFTGVFEGNGHTISNFRYNSTDADYVGLFGEINGGQIKNLGLIDAEVDAGTGNYVGSLVGFLRDGTIMGSYVEGGSVAGHTYVGGLVGLKMDGSILNCYSTASIEGNFRVGGLCGDNHGTISQSSAAGSVSGGEYVGGMVGINYDTITDCYAASIVTGGQRTGGLVGWNFGTITSCYSIGSVTAEWNTKFAGGLVGQNWKGAITDCYATGNVLGGGRVGGLVGENFNGKITNSYAKGSVTGGAYDTGGLVGKNDQESTITNCYSSGSVTGVFFGRRTGGIELG